MVCIFAAALAGGGAPFVKRREALSDQGFPLGEAFAVGVFLALALIIMLPAGLHLVGKAWPGWDYPIAALIAASAFIGLLLVEHYSQHLRPRPGPGAMQRTSPAIPVIMTIMIAAPSFFLGAALGISSGASAWMIFIAILAHKSSAGFALALKMVRSDLRWGLALALFGLFALSTPLGILVGDDLQHILTGPRAAPVKGVILSLAAGTFLYMGTLHEMRHAPLIKDCAKVKGFLSMLSGFGLTALVRWLMGTAHHL